jgi:hypothetical protein
LTRKWLNGHPPTPQVMPMLRDKSVGRGSRKP